MKLLHAVLRQGMFAAVIACLSGCAQLDSVRLHFPTDKPGVITLIATTTVFGKMASKGGNWEQLVRDVEACGLTAKKADRTAQFRFDASLNFSNLQTLQASLDCFPADWKKRQIDFAVSESFWSTDYEATIWLEQPLLVLGNGELERYLPAKGSRAGHMGPPGLSMMPLELSVEMPANVTSIENFSAIKNANITQDRKGNVATIKLNYKEAGPLSIAEAKINGMPDYSAGASVPSDRYHFTVHARRSKFEIGSIGWLISLFGLVFGSGIGVQIFNWIKVRKVRAKVGGDEQAQRGPD